jgi:hypothetical protein
MTTIGNKGMIGVLSSERNNFTWQFIQCLLELKTRMGSDVSITYAHSGTIPDGRNLVLDIAKKHNCDYVLMIDSDMTFPNHGILTLKDTMEQMDASIGCGLYFGTYPPYKSAPMAYLNEGDTHRPLTEWKEAMYVDSCGMGFTLITKDLFDIKFEFRPGKGEDYLFCTEAQKQGAKIILDPQVRCGHLRTIALDEDIIRKLGI